MGYLKATEIDGATDQLKPDLKVSDLKDNFFGYLKRALAKCMLRTRLHAVFYKQRDAQETQTYQILKGLQCKILFCVHKDINPTRPVDDLIRFLARKNMANPSWPKRNMLIKGMGDEVLFGLLHITPKTHLLAYS